MVQKYIWFFIFCSCIPFKSNPHGYPFFPGWTATARQKQLYINFELKFNRKVVDHTDYGEPPQLAIWLEQPDQGIIKTIFVTRRTARGDWAGKMECPVSLPYWVSRYNLETNTKGLPSHKDPAPDGITGATPDGKLKVAHPLTGGGGWRYFIEVNLSGDYNREFPANFDDGSPDPQGNGQPSLVFGGSIVGKPGAVSFPKIIGRTDQLQRVRTLNKNLAGITSARKIFSDMKVFITDR